MSARTLSRGTPLVFAGVLALAAPASAADPVFDPMQPNTGPTATAPRQAEREMRRDLERKTPTLTERLGLPPVSGPLPPIVPAPQNHPALLDPGRDAVPPPPQPRPQRARQRNRDG